MSASINQMIEYEGINVSLQSKYDYFKQFAVEDVTRIAPQKKDIGQLLKVRAKAEIISNQIVKTPKGVSLEGQVMTGFKLFVTGQINLQYQYVSFDLEQLIHTAEGKIIFCEHLTMPSNYTESQLFFSQVSIEDIFCRQLDAKNISNSLTMMLIAGFG